MFVDTHCHLNMMVDKKRDEKLTEQQICDIASIVQSAQQAGVSRIINVGTTINETLNSLALAQRYESVYATAGIHPCDATADWQKQFADLHALLKKERHNLVGIGETGLDFYHKPFDVNAQTNFTIQAGLSVLETHGIVKDMVIIPVELTINNLGFNAEDIDEIVPFSAFIRPRFNDNIDLDFINSVNVYLIESPDFRRRELFYLDFVNVGLKDEIELLPTLLDIRDLVKIGRAHV